MKLSLDSPVMEKAEGIADIIIAGFLWLIFSVPIITIGPASIALYYTVAKVCRRKRDTVWHAFLHAFKINLKQGIACTVIYLLYLGVIIFYFYITFENAGQGNPMLLLAGILLVVPFLFTLLYIFPVISRFGGSLGKMFQYAFHMSMRYFPVTILLLLLSGTVGVLIVLLPVCLAILPGIYVWISSFLLEKILKKYVIWNKEDSDSGEVPWYLEG